MYRRENELRLSEETQSEMDKYFPDKMEKYDELITTIQKKVLKEFGYQGNEKDLDLFRKSLGMYKNDKEVQSIPYYAKHNRAIDGNLKEGDQINDVKLYQIDFEKGSTTLFAHFEEISKQNNLEEEDAFFVLIGGSIT